MREIKFRAWFEDESLMSYVAMNNVYFLRNRYFYLSPASGSKFKAIKLMQYTGLKDAAGREVYEGDILKRVVNIRLYGTDLNENVEEVVKVSWNEDYAGFYAGEYELFSVLHATHDRATQCSCTVFEVIGNIYEGGTQYES